MESSSQAPLQAVRVEHSHLRSRARSRWGALFGIISGISGVGFAWLASFIVNLPAGQILYAVLNQEHLLLMTLVVSGLSAAVSLLFLVPEFLALFPIGWVRTVLGIVVTLADLAAAALWAIYFMFSLFGVLVSDSSKVTADNGQSVVVHAQLGVKGDGYRVYRQRSQFIYESSLDGTTKPLDFPTQHCTLVVQGPDLILTCGQHTIHVPPEPK